MLYGGVISSVPICLTMEAIPAPSPNPIPHGLQSASLSELATCTSIPWQLQMLTAALWACIARATSQMGLGR